MTAEEIRDAREQETHDAVIQILPLVHAHNKSLYGNGRKGAMDRLTRIESIAVIIPVVGLVIGAITLWCK